MTFKYFTLMFITIPFPLNGKFRSIPEYKNDDNYVDGAAYALTQQDGMVV